MTCSRMYQRQMATSCGNLSKLDRYYRTPRRFPIGPSLPLTPPAEQKARIELARKFASERLITIGNHWSIRLRVYMTFDEYVSLIDFVNIHSTS